MESSSAMQSQKAVSAYTTSKKILLFGFAEQSWSLWLAYNYNGQGFHMSTGGLVPLWSCQLSIH